MKPVGHPRHRKEAERLVTAGHATKALLEGREGQGSPTHYQKHETATHPTLQCSEDVLKGGHRMAVTQDPDIPRLARKLTQGAMPCIVPSPIRTVDFNVGACGVALACQA